MKSRVNRSNNMSTKFGNELPVYRQFTRILGTWLRNHTKWVAFFIHNGETQFKSKKKKFILTLFSVELK